MGNVLDMYGVMQRVPQITGLSLEWVNGCWQGRYYIDGTPHSWRKDKLRIKLWRSTSGVSIWLHEQGGRSMSLSRWLQEYGGAADWKEARAIMEGNSMPDRELLSVIRKHQECVYVDRELYGDIFCAYPLSACPLYNFLSGIFGCGLASEVFNRYGVTTDAFGNAVFWYIDIDGNILHDKRIAYGSDGHRDKNKGSWRKFKSADGYNGRCLFGANTIPQDDETVYVVESEKTALICALGLGGVFVASGGKNTLRDIDDRCVLLPDMDAIEDWSRRGNIGEWWRAYEMGDKEDIGDLVLRLSPDERLLLRQLL